MVRRWFNFVVLLLTCASAYGLRYRETIEVEWGVITLPDGEGAQEMWFARQPPTFAATFEGNSFTERERSCLTSLIGAHLGKTEEGESVFPLSREELDRFADAVRRSACFGAGEFAVVNSLDAPEDDDAARRKSWEMRVGFERRPNDLSSGTDTLNPTANPGLELILVVDEVPLGTVLQTTLPALLRDPQVRAYAGLTTDEVARAESAASWVTVYLASQSTLARNPTDRTVESLAGPSTGQNGDVSSRAAALDVWAVPLGYGLRTAVEIAGVMPEERRFEAALAKRLSERIVPGRSETFATASQWIPGDATNSPPLDRFEFSSEGGARFDVFVNFPAANETAGSDRFPSIQTDRSSWVVRAGPFVRIREIKPVIRAIAMGPALHPVDTLGEGRPPDWVAQQREAIAEIEERMKNRLSALLATRHGQPWREGGYYWAPAWRAFHLHALRELDNLRFTDGMIGQLDGKGIATYSGLYRLAEVSGKIGGGYAPEQGFGVDTEISASGLLHPRDALSVDLSWAENVLGGGLSYRLPVYRNLDRHETRVDMALLASVQGSEDEAFRLGGLWPETRTRQSTSGGIDHELVWSRGPWRMKLLTGVLWETYRLTHDGRLTDVDGLAIRHAHDWEYQQDEVDGASGVWTVAFGTRASYRPDVGWESPFWTADFSLRATWSFGGKAGEPRPYFVFAETGAGLSDADVPDAVLYRVGDGQFLIGLEPGEFSGRRFVRGNLTAGILLSHLLQRVADLAPAQLPPMLQTIFFQTSAEWAQVEGQGRSPRQQEREQLSSYSLALALPQEIDARSVSLRIGYGWSPESLRKRGRFFTALAWRF